MKKFNFKKWIKAATVRSIKTMAQSAVALIGTSTLITEIDVKAVISAVILAGILSLLTSTAGLPEVSEEE
jgi:conserved domain protein